MIVIWRTCNIHILLIHIIIEIILDKWRKKNGKWLKKKLHRKTYFKWNLIQTWEMKKKIQKNIIFVISYLWSNQIRKLREFIQPLKMEEKKLQFNIRIDKNYLHLYRIISILYCHETFFLTIHLIHLLKFIHTSKHKT